MIKIQLLKFLSFALLAGIIVQTAPISAASPSATAPNAAAGTNTSLNWAGYVATGAGYTYTSVSGTWTVPSSGNPAATSGNATWVGVGGVSSDDLIQCGTQAITNSSGQTTYQAWYELLPQSSQAIPITVTPGNSVTATITQQSNGQWLVSFRNNTTSINYQTTVAYSSSLGSAEWIEEMPSLSNNRFVPLDNFGTVQFSNGSTTRNGSSFSIAGSGATALTMINNANLALATTSAISSDGAGFTVTRTNATPAVSSSGGYSSYGRGWSRPGVGIKSFRSFPAHNRSNRGRFQVNFHSFKHIRISFGR